MPAEQWGQCEYHYWDYEPWHKNLEELVNLRRIQKAQCSSRWRQELRNISMSNYDVILLRSVRYGATPKAGAVSYSPLLAPRPGGELAEGVAAT